jgi:hypothetical protein
LRSTHFNEEGNNTMNNYKNIQATLEQFIKKYYTNELIKGAILFFAIGLLYSILTLLIEYFLWLSPTARMILFWLFVAVEVALFAKFIAIPLAKLFKIQRGINYATASEIIGNHFPEVSDKLLNVLQLYDNRTDSELLLASIDQKSSELSPIPFKLAVNFNTNVKYLKYAAIPVLILLVTYVSGKFNWFSDSYERVVNYQTAYEPPAPFQFFVVNNDLQALERKDYRLQVRTSGEITPENVQITYNNETYFLQQKDIGEFEYVFTKPREAITFKLFANAVTSKPYTLEVLKVPTLLNFEMALDYPAYTQKRDEVLKSSGNATVPQGTNITWKLSTRATDQVFLYAKDTVAFTSETPDNFSASKRVYNNLNYSLSTSNANLKDYENLAFSIDIIKDEYPELNVKMEQDTLDLETLYFYGQVSDDYGLSKLQLVYYPSENDADKTIEPLPISKSNFDEFVNAFPNNLPIKEGVAYDLYFQVFDNDAVSKYKSVKSKVFTYRKRTKAEEEEKQLQEQSKTIQDLNKSLDKFEKQEKQLEEFSKTQKEKSELNFNDKKKFEEFLKRQKRQENLMQNFNKKLKDNLEEFQKENEEQDQFKEDLKERLKENEQQLKQDEKLLKELEKLQDKLNKEEFTEKLEKLAKQNKNKKRSLEQLLELTKRYYVSKKMEKLQKELEKLAEKQEALSKEKDEKNTKEEQDKLNKEFDEFKKELEELEKDNKELKQPVDIPRDKLTEEEVDWEQKNASEKLERKEQPEEKEPQEQEGAGEKQEPQDPQEPQKPQDSPQSGPMQEAQKSQKKAAKKMKKMAQEMAQSMPMGGGGGDQAQEDMDMLRQILDNLVLFSMDQEKLMEQFKSIQVNHNKYANYLRKQSSLREHFEHVDDSLFALSLRQPKISEKVNKEITNTFYSIDKSLALFSENRLYQGTASQQYTITAANNLASFLSDVLDQMDAQMQMSPSQGGKGDQQLPDIIMSQEQLNKEMQEQMEKQDGKKEGEKEGEEEGEKGEKEGEEGDKKDGEKEGKEGENGKEGEGKPGEGKPGEGEQYNEDLNGKLYEIYQQQQQLRQQLQDRIAKDGLKGNAEQLLKQMEEVEQDLLNKGFTNQTMQKMMELQHQLLKLENATFQQGQDNKRKSKTNKEQFNNTTINQIPTAKQYFNTTEILNRQALPLQQVYKKKVQEYFKKTND